MLLEADFNLSIAILFMFPNADATEDFRVETENGEIFKLVEWNLDETLPTIEQLQIALDNEKTSPDKPTLEERLLNVEQVINYLLLEETLNV